MPSDALHPFFSSSLPVVVVHCHAGAGTCVCLVTDASTRTVSHNTPLHLHTLSHVHDVLNRLLIRTSLLDAQGS
ncbi:hypothetical protein EV363DRAFT_1399465 [Boletus edulis]|uniref:Uncharacterized protein n=1 Tax=Boletus edulis BED1 TaxID=1328754 RepID=A0AAD4BSZ3_BOLED|nr:hypothetical protein EV363DRAFT_1399465 [Boletus edulis]KAF8438573.1 hypothetical protein L210DRAFT_3544437 [Boletus edulis BED1]